MSDRTNFYLILSLLLLVIFNIVVLDLNAFKKAPIEKNSTVSLTVSPTPAVLTCPQPCLDLISSKFASVVTTSAVAPVQTLANNIKEFYVPLGSGATKNQDYEFLLAAEATINSQDYPNIKEVWFEVFLHIPTGNGTMYVKLFDVTEGHDVWLSEVSSSGGQTVKETAKVTLDSGNKTYRLMAKSSMGYDAVADQARLKIVLN